LKSHLHNIPTHIITGFLGVGKTTAILSLLHSKPPHEQWAILVNELGEIGVDGTVLTIDHKDRGGVSIQEVPGGCLCCAASVPLKVALNTLLKQSQPDRLLIEPTGLGHPKQIISALSQPEYHSVLNLRATLTLVDARKVSDPRYRDHPTFQQQLTIADLIVANKSDLYHEDELERLQQYLSDLGLDSTPVHPVAHGAIDPKWLDLPHHNREKSAPVEFCTTRSTEQEKQNSCVTAEQFTSQGWQFDHSRPFQFDCIRTLLSQLKVIRMKAVILTERGGFLFNRIDDQLSIVEHSPVTESRIELIDQDATRWDSLHEQLNNCLIEE